MTGSVSQAQQLAWPGGQDSGFFSQEQPPTGQHNASFGMLMPFGNAKWSISATTKGRNEGRKAFSF